MHDTCEPLPDPNGLIHGRFGTGVMLLIGGFCLLANLFLPGVFWNVYASSMQTAMACAVAGGLAAQIGMAALWSGMSASPWPKRTAVGLAVTFLTCCSYIVGLQLPEYYAQPTMPRFVAWFLLAIGGGGWLIAFAALSALGRWNHCDIHRGWRQADRTSNQSAPLAGMSSRKVSNYTISYLALITAMVALAVTVLQLALPKQDYELPPVRMMTAIVVVCLLHLGLIIGFLGGGTFMLLSSVLRKRGALFLAATLCLGYPLACFWMVMSDQLPFGSLELLYFCAFQLGAYGSILALLGVARILGFRLIVEDQHDARVSDVESDVCVKELLQTQTDPQSAGRE